MSQPPGWALSACRFGHTARRWGLAPSVIDLAMMKLSLALLRQAHLKAQGAYGPVIRQDLEKALLRLQTRQGWLARCMQAMAEPKAVVWKRLRMLRRS